MIIKKLFESLSKQGILILYYGILLSLGLLIIGIFSFEANKIFWNESYNNALWSIKIITSAQSLFVQSFLGALIFECVNLSKK